MNAVILNKPDGTPTGYLLCQECNTVFSPGDPDVAEKCCTCYDCWQPLPKDERVPYADGRGKSLYHRECERKRRAKRDAKRLEEAGELVGYDGPVYFEGGHGSYGDSYFADVHELAEWLDDQEFLAQGDDRPVFAFCCEEHPFPEINLQGILESACDDMDDDAYERLDGIDELEAACEKFREANKGVTSWYVDNNCKVRIPPFAGSAIPAKDALEAGDVL